MSLQQTVDAVYARSRAKVDSYMNRSNRMDVETSRLTEMSARCSSEAKGLEPLVTKCLANYDQGRDKYRCESSESRASVEREIVELKQAIAARGAVAVPRRSGWGAVRGGGAGGYRKPFMTDGACSSRQLRCQWNGVGTPQRLGAQIDMSYLDQGDVYLICEAQRNGERVIFAPPKRMSRTKNDNRDARVIDWNQAFSMYGNSKIYKSLISGPCDI